MVESHPVIVQCEKTTDTPTRYHGVFKTKDTIGTPFTFYYKHGRWQVELTEADMTEWPYDGKYGEPEDDECTEEFFKGILEGIIYDHCYYDCATVWEIKEELSTLGSKPVDNLT